MLIDHCRRRTLFRGPIMGCLVVLTGHVSLWVVYLSAWTAVVCVSHSSAGRTYGPAILHQNGGSQSPDWVSPSIDC